MPKSFACAGGGKGSLRLLSDVGVPAWQDRAMRWREMAVPSLLIVVPLLTGLAGCRPAPNPPTKPGTSRVVVFGDSVPAWLIGAGSSQGVDGNRYTLLNGALSACDSSLPYYPARWGTSEVVPVPAVCPQGWRKHYPPFLATRPDVAVIMGGVHAMLDHKIDGAWVHPCRAAARSWYYEDLKARLNYLKVHARKAVLVLPAWPGPNSRWIMPADYVKRANCVREVMTNAANVRNVPIIDMGAYLCPSGPDACGTSREDNGIHVDGADAADTLRWLLARVVAI